MPANRSCLKCELADNSNGLFTCNGCQQSFCSIHLEDHSRELRDRFDRIADEYNSVRDNLDHDKQNFNEDCWRTYEKELNAIKLILDKNQMIPNYSEKNLDEWMQRLGKVTIQLTKPDRWQPLTLRLGQLFHTNAFRICLLLIFIVPMCCCLSSNMISEKFSSHNRFSDVNGPIQLLENAQVAEHDGGIDFVPGSFRVKQTYSNDVHHIRFVFEKLSPSNAFIGIITSGGEQSLTVSHGWFIGDKQLISHQPGEYQIVQTFRKLWSGLINALLRRGVEAGDTIEIMIDCINSKIVLKNERTNNTHELRIDQKHSPLPWQIFIHLNRHGDRVRLQ